MTENKNVWQELLSQKAEVVAGIAGSGQDKAKLRELAESLGRELELEARYQGFLSEAERLTAERQRKAVQNSEENEGAKADTEWTFASLEKGERARVACRAYLARQKERGKSYTKTGRIYYRNGDGVVLGVTFSSDNGGTWFLNLKKNQFQEAVLMCQSGPRSVTAIHLPREFVEKYGKHFSEDKKGQVKFNFLRDGNKWLLDVLQPIGKLDVTKYADPKELVCTRTTQYV